MNQQRTTHSAKKSGGSRSRYSDFLNQRHTHHLAGGRAGVARVGQGLINIGIFVGLFVGILTLFGLGLSQINRSKKTNTNGSPTAPIQSPAESSTGAGSSTGMPPPPTVYPSGHAEVKIPPSPNPTSTAEIKKKSNLR